METFSMEGHEFGPALASHVLARLYDAQSHLVQVFDAHESESRSVHLKAALGQLEALIALATPGVLGSDELLEF